MSSVDFKLNAQKLVVCVSVSVCFPVTNMEILLSEKRRNGRGFGLVARGVKTAGPARPSPRWSV